jgi:putative heme-binding domain-containing protein
VLKGIASRVPPEYLLESLVLPSARIADGYATTSVELSNGDEVDGVRLSETGGELTLRMANGVVRRIPRRTILRQTTSSVSAMPPMGEVLTSFELRDLMAYLISLKEPAGASTR